MSVYLNNKQKLQTASLGKSSKSGKTVMALGVYSPVTAYNAAPHESCVSSSMCLRAALLIVCCPLLTKQHHRKVFF